MAVAVVAVAAAALCSSVAAVMAVAASAAAVVKHLNPLKAWRPVRYTEWKLLNIISDSDACSLGMDSIYSSARLFNCFFLLLLSFGCLVCFSAV